MDASIDTTLLKLEKYCSGDTFNFQLLEVTYVTTTMF